MRDTVWNRRVAGIGPSLVAVTLAAGTAGLGPTAGRAGGQVPAPLPQAPEPVGVEPKIVFKLDRAEGRPGDLVTLHITIETNTPLKAVSIAVNFDETRLRVENTERVLEPVNPAPNGDLAKVEEDSKNDTPGDQTDEGWIYIELVAPESKGDLGLELSKEALLYKLNFRIRRDAAEGFTPVVFGKVGPADVVTGYRNAAQLREDVVLPADFVLIPEENLVGGGVIILGIGEIGFFLRADADMSRKLDISDPIRTLNYLFLGTEKLHCFDSADSNDDGSLDLADAVYTLNWLYASGKPPPDPRYCGGVDPTPDPLGCEQPDCESCHECDLAPL